MGEQARHVVALSYLFAVVFLCVFGVGSLFVIVRHSDKLFSQKSTPADPTKVREGLVAVEARALMASYERNEVKADQVYKDLWFVVTGEVKSIGKGVFGGMYITIDGPADSIFDVQCSFDENWETALAGLKPGQPIRVAGVCTGKLGNVFMEKCQIVPTHYEVRQ